MTAHKKCLMILFSLLVLTFQLFSEDEILTLENLDSLYNLSYTRFLFKAEDRMFFKDVQWNDSGWKSIPIISPWQMGSPEDKDYHGIGWYRLTIDIESLDSSLKYGIMYPYSLRASEVYLNGELIHRAGNLSLKDMPVKGSRPELFSLPEGLLKEGRNILAVRAGSLDGWGGLNSGYLYLGEMKQLQQKWTRFIIQHIAIAFSCLFLTLFYFIHYLLRREDKYYLWISLLTLSIAMFTLGYFALSMYIYDSYFSYAVLTFLGGINTYYFTFKFLHSFLGKPQGKVGNVLEAIYISLNVVLLVEYLITGHIAFFVKYVYGIFMLMNFVGLIYLVVVNIRAIREKIEYALHLFWGIFILFISLTYSVLIFITVLRSPPVVGEGFFIMAVVFATIAAQRFAVTHKKLAEAHVRLQSLDKLKDDFLANTSHELRTPLTGIIGLADSMLFTAGDRLEKEEIESLNLIAASGRRLASLVNDILDFSQLKRREVVLHESSIDLFELTSAVLVLSRPLVGGKNVEIVNQIPGELPAVLADENRLQQVLYNLIGNAIKFTEQGLISIEAEQRDHFICVSVRDTGIGIPEDKLDMIFKSFEQVDSSISREYGGTGIGLAVAKQFVELHGGEIWVESEVSRGSVFFFTIPVSSEKPEALSSGQQRLSRVNIQIEEDMGQVPAKAGTDENSHSVMVVDDEPVNLKVYREQLVSRGYDVVTAASGQEALDRVSEGYKPDLILLDVMMPRMTGYEVCEELRKVFSPDILPIIMVTAKNQVNDLVTSLEKGASDFLSKPFSRDELLARVQTHISLKVLVDQNMELNQNLEKKVVERTKELHEKNSKIMDSIRYAGVIQGSILPGKELLKKIFKEYFLLWKPRDIVGGDFYWLYEMKEDFLIAIGDCTGHGVPGALMTMTATSVLGRVADHICNDDPAVILKNMNHIMKSLINQKNQKTLNDDGLELSICYYQKKESRLIFAGAGMRLHMVRDGEWMEYKGDRQGLGYEKAVDNKEYTNHVIDLKGNENFYITTDGVLDQCGGEFSYCFGRSRFKDIFMNNQHLPLMKQYELLEETLRVYQGDEDQRDDMTLLAFTL